MEAGQEDFGSKVRALRELSCDGLPKCDSSSSSTKSCFNLPSPLKCKRSDEKIESDEPAKTPSCYTLASPTESSDSSVSGSFFNLECVHYPPQDTRVTPNLEYETSIAKSILQQYSTISGDNLFDHLADVIKRVIEERPPNVIDFFEEFSRNVREQKFHLPERFPPDAVYEEGNLLSKAKKHLLSMKVGELDLSDEATEEAPPSIDVDLDLKLELNDVDRILITSNERVQQLQFYWNQCGFSISSDDIFQLAMAIDALEYHPSILQCRFWGMMTGLKASYYVVEATLTSDETRTRNEQMDLEMREKYPMRLPEKPSKRQLPTHIGHELTPGIFGWEEWPADELEKMLPVVVPVPVVQEIETFDCPPEKVGEGVNRYSYFVINKFSDNWIQLPMITPKQIVVSRQIKKFLTGDLEADIFSCPDFPGKEKHYLRAMIARITAGTYIAPEGYYRKMTKKEQRLFDGTQESEEEESADDESTLAEDEEDDMMDNDMILLKNEKYEPLPIEAMAVLGNWVHVRPNILNQGRVKWLDEENARKERDKELQRYIKSRLREEQSEQMTDTSYSSSDDEEEVEEEMLNELVQPEIGPPILHPIIYDVGLEYSTPWVARYTSNYTNENERMVFMRSNVWPGAFTFAFGKLCESIYMGYGHKYTSRNMAFHHLPAFAKEHSHGEFDFIEKTDPTVVEEMAYQMSLLKKRAAAESDGETMGEDEHEHSSYSGSRSNESDDEV